MTQLTFNPDNGLLQSIGSDGGDLNLAVQFHGWTVEIDNKSFTPRSAKLESHNAPSQNRRVSVYAADRFKITWTYEIPEGRSFTTACLEIERVDGAGFSLGRIELLNLRTEDFFDEIFDYWTMESCPFAIIARSGESSLLAVTENPFCDLTVVNPRFGFAFDARLKIPDNENYQSEPFYLTVVEARDNHFIGRWLPKTNGAWPDRGGLPNPKNRILDTAEVRAFQEILKWRIPRYRKDYGMYCDADWVGICQQEKLGKPNRAETDGEASKIVQQYKSLIDNMAELGCDRIVIDHGLRNDENALPVDSDIGWEPHKNAVPILQYAAEKGTAVGLYNGSGNPWPESQYIYKSTVPFLPDQRREWKVLDANGDLTYRAMVRARDGKPTPINCLGSRGFREWFIMTQSSTIRRNELFWWGWDDVNSGVPGRDTWQYGAIECFSKDHEHLPGNATYVQWRAAMEVTAQMRERNPDLWMQCYWGFKRAGPFSLKFFDTHENYYEYFVPRDDPFRGGFNWGDRELAWPSCNDIRLQYWYNYNERFLPPYLTYAPVANRIEELIAAIAAGGAIVIYEFISENNIKLFKRWIEFAHENAELLQFTYQGLYGPPRRGAVDGWAHIKESGGFLFLFNPNKAVKSVEIPISAEIGLSPDTRSWSIRERGPEIGVTLRFNGATRFPYGSSIEMDIEAASFLVLEILPAAAEKSTPVVNATCEDETAAAVAERDVSASGKVQKPFFSLDNLKAELDKLPKAPAKPQHSVFHQPGSIAF